MPMLEWNDSLSIKVAEVDTQHKWLVGMVNKLYDSMKGEKGEVMLLGIVGEMRRYTEVHFGTEEKLMDQYEYPDTAAHKAEHRDFIAKVTQVENDCKSGKSTLSMEVLNFLGNWLVTHINGTDKTMGVFLSGKGVS